MNHKDAVHDKLDEFQKLHHIATKEFSIVAIKTSSIVSGGAVVVGLAFVSSMYSSGHTEVAQKLFSSVFIFAVGALISGFASVLVYFYQRELNAAAGQIKATDSEPFLEKTSQHSIKIRNVNFIDKIIPVFIVLPYVCVIIGLLLSWCAIK